MVPLLKKIGLLAKIDRAAFAAYCLAYAELTEATRLLEAEGRILDVPIVKRRKDRTDEVVGTTKKLHPATALVKDASDRMRMFLIQFGLTPASRSRIQVGDAQEDEDPFEQFLRGKASPN